MDPLGIILTLCVFLAVTETLPDESRNPPPIVQVTCKRANQYLPDTTNRCRYVICIRSSYGRLVPENRPCRAGWRVPRKFRKGFRNPCTRRDRECSGEEQTDVQEDLAQMEAGKKMPKRVRLRLRVNRKEKRLNLVRNDNVKPDVPIILGKNGRMEKWNKDSDYAYYTDVATQASFVVWNEDTQWNRKRKYRGNFGDGNDIYTIKPRADKSPKMRMPRAGNIGTQDNRYVVYKEDFKREGFYTDGAARNMTFEEQLMKQAMNVKDPGTVRGRAAGKKTYTLEMLLFIDYDLYKKRYDEVEGSDPDRRQEEAVQDIRLYFAHIINGVALRYMNVEASDYELLIKLVGMYVATTPMDSPYSSMPPARDIHKNVGYVQGDELLKQFENWLEDNTDNGNLPANDQATLFTGNVMWTHVGRDGNRVHIYGYAPYDAVCRFWRVSLNEDVGEFGSAQTAAHELGHNLGGRHDGRNGNTCDTQKQYIMATSPLTQTDENYKNGYKFSSCSVDEFRKYINGLNQEGRNCMTNSAKNIPELDVKNRPLPGQKLTPDQQCKLVFGSTSYYCGGATTDANICQRMTCFHNRYKYCFANFDNRAATGTPCGNKKWCYMSDCVYDSRAPEGKDYCIYGDYKGRRRDGNQTCVELVRDTPWKCYEKRHRDDCCESCENIRQKDNPSCEYGDKVQWCSGIDQRSCYSNNATCCGTCAKLNTGIKGCAFGDKADWCSTMFLGYCYDEETKSCCQHCLSRKRKDNKGCEYGDRASYCKQYTGERCYVEEANCCETCARWRTDIPGCEYGDRVKGCTTKDCGNANWRRDCCYTCRNGATQTPLPTTPPPPTTMPPTTTKITTGGPACSGGDLDQDCGSISASECYQKFSRCCATCRRHWKGVLGCEFGDKADYCSGIHPGQCRYYIYTRMCCATCPRYLTDPPPTTTSPPTTTTPVPTTTNAPSCYDDRASWCSTIGRHDCYVVDHICCRKCRGLKYGRKGCEYGDRVSWCNKMTRDRCYQTDIFIYCCDKCERDKEDTPGCEFGDRRNDCAGSNCADPVIKDGCCKTCGVSR